MDDMSEGRAQEFLSTQLQHMFSSAQIAELMAYGAKDPEGMVRVIHNMPQVQAELQQKLYELLTYYSTPLKQEHPLSDVRYGEKYAGVEIAFNQMRILKEYDWGRKIKWEMTDVQRNWCNMIKPIYGTEGCFVVPFVKSMIEDHTSGKVDYETPLRRVLQMISVPGDTDLRTMLPFDRELSRQYYRRTLESSRQMRKLWELQGSPKHLMVIPASFGMHYRAYSFDVVSASMRSVGVPLDMYEVAVMLLTHPERFKLDHELNLLATGSEYSSEGDGVLYDSALHLSRSGGTLRVCSFDKSHTSPYNGPVYGQLVLTV